MGMGDRKIGGRWVRPLEKLAWLRGQPSNRGPTRRARAATPRVGGPGQTGSPREPGAGVAGRVGRVQWTVEEGAVRVGALLDRPPLELLTSRGVVCTDRSTELAGLQLRCCFLKHR